MIRCWFLEQTPQSQSFKDTFTPQAKKGLFFRVESCSLGKKSPSEEIPRANSPFLLMEKTDKSFTINYLNFKQQKANTLDTHLLVSN